ncbi:subtilisin-like serine-protease S [Primulina tabacum]|uniref:subtilisin-like serine-protease S n=1 Tax=Primulina tabacum TaxID=48773 RepID=UPI003F5A92DD
MKTLINFVLLYFLFNIVHGSNVTSAADGRKHYIVYMGSHSFPSSKSVISSNHDLLSSVTGSTSIEAQKAIIYHYHRSFRGFSAMLTPEEAHKISYQESVVSVFENQNGHLETSRSWDFVGAAAQSVFTVQSEQKDLDVIVGHLDSGIWPESPSFRADGFGPAPARWKGHCPDEPQCNNKVIGYRWYSRGFEQENGPIVSYGGRHYFSARDDFGHGTHTASTVAGMPIGLSMKGMGGDKVIRGGAPGARLAVYKVCWFNRCTCSDLLKAFDDAIADGVDIVTFSIGGFVRHNRPGFMSDCISIGTLHAFEKGILFSSSAGNSREPETVDDAAPWMLTVAATSTDRELVATVELGNSETLRGQGFNYYDMNGYNELVYGRNAAKYWRWADSASFCKEGTLDPRVVWGKIVVCIKDSWNDKTLPKSDIVRENGGIGVIVVDPYSSNDMSLNFMIPTTVIGVEDARKLDAYMRSTSRPFAYIRRHEAQINQQPAPKMAVFSSRGPGSALDIIKPDVAAPGLNILASWPTWNHEDPGRPWFGFDSGTSMSAPHAAAIGATLKGIHPNFSPAAIKSAIMTTASHLDNTGGPIQSDNGKATPFDMGSGNINPNNALNPGLIYDYNMNDMIAYLCNIANSKTIGNILRARVTCPSPGIPSYNLNYPSIFVSNLHRPVKVTRTTTYVGNEGDPKSFHVKVENPEGVLLEVEPSVLDFSDGKNTATYIVNVVPNSGSGKYVFGSITWSNDVHSVRSPVAIRVS